MQTRGRGGRCLGLFSLNFSMTGLEIPKRRRGQVVTGRDFEPCKETLIEIHGGLVVALPIFIGP